MDSPSIKRSTINKIIQILVFIKNYSTKFQFIDCTEFSVWCQKINMNVCQIDGNWINEYVFSDNVHFYQLFMQISINEHIKQTILSYKIYYRIFPRNCLNRIMLKSWNFCGKLFWKWSGCLYVIMNEMHLRENGFWKMRKLDFHNLIWT